MWCISTAKLPHSRLTSLFRRSHPCGSRTARIHYRALCPWSLGREPYRAGAYLNAPSPDTRARLLVSNVTWWSLPIMEISTSHRWWPGT